MTAKKLYRVYGIVLGAVSVIAGICLMAGCLHIYEGGAYSAEAVAQTFRSISLPVYLWLVLAVAGLLAAPFLPVSRDKAASQPEMALRRLQQKACLSADPELQRAIVALRNARKRERLLVLCLLVTGFAPFLSYACNGLNFDQEDINGSMRKAFLLMLACLAIPLVSAIVTAYRARASVLKEIALLKQLPKKEAVPSPAHSKRIPVARLCILAAAAACLIYGLVAGGAADVLTKAVNICTECIGLG